MQYGMGMKGQRDENGKEVSSGWLIPQAIGILKEETKIRKIKTIIKVIIKVFLSWKKYLTIQPWKDLPGPGKTKAGQIFSPEAH